MFKRKTTYTIPEGYREHIEAAAPTIKYRGNTTIHPEAYISDTCWIVGDVRIGYHAIVMHGACLRGDCDYIEIGAETNIQETAFCMNPMVSPSLLVNTPHLVMAALSTPAKLVTIPLSA